MSECKQTPFLDSRAFFKLTYGMFLLTAKDGEKDNGCIINTVAQITDASKRIVMSVSKRSYTHDMIQKTRKFNVSILTEETPVELIQRFGFQSGRTADKFAGFDAVKRSRNALYYLDRYANAFLSAEVTETHDYETHTLFVADVTEAVTLSGEASMTYQYYQEHKKPKKVQAEKKDNAGQKGEFPEMKKYVCGPCGYEYDPEAGDPDNGIVPGTAFEDLPEDWVCPVCGLGKEVFEEVQ